MNDYLADSRVEDVELTCNACPEQYEGTLVDGRPFYFRYRAGYASLAVGGDCRGRSDVGMDHGDSLQGAFDSETDRNRVFSVLLNQWSAR